MNSTVAVVGVFPEALPTCQPEMVPMPPSAWNPLLLVVPKVPVQTSVAIPGSTSDFPFQVKVGGVAPHLRNFPM